MKRVILLSLIAVALAPAQTPQELFQQGLVKERSEGKLEEAMQLYRRAAEGAGKDRALAAKALLQLAAGYEKLGNTESRKIYERVVREFADQKEAAATARMRLGGGESKGAGIVARQVWADAIDAEGAPSPDGRFVSFVDWGTGDLALRDLATGENRRLTNKGPWSGSAEFALHSVFSRDGKQVAFAWYNSRGPNNKDLRITSATNSTVVSTSRVLYRNDEIVSLLPSDWSADGKQILARLTMKDRTNQIAMISVADGSAKILKTLDWRAPRKMSLSPDGLYIAYDFQPQEDSPQRDIFVLAADGSRESALVEHPSNDALPVWTPDGKRVLFTSDRTGANSLWSLPVTHGRPEGQPDLVKADVGSMMPMAFTRKGSLFYGLVFGDTNVYTGTLDPDTGKLVAPMRAVSHRFTGLNTSPDWSSDGRQFAYFSRRDQSVPEATICVHSLDKSKERELKLDLSYIGGLRWSPDNRTLAVWGANNKGRKGIFLVDHLSGVVSPVSVTGEDFRDPVWSPDGRSLYYRSGGRVVVWDRGTGREKEILSRGWLAINYLALSRDGTKLAMLVERLLTKSMAIYVMSSAGGEPREILTLPEGISGLVLDWEPSGRNLVFARANNNELWRVLAEGGKPERIDINMKNIRHLRLHPDGRQIAFSADMGKSEVWALENLLPTLTANK